LHIFGAITQFERRLIAERTRDGLATARIKGRRSGGLPLDQDKRAAALLLVKRETEWTPHFPRRGYGRCRRPARGVAGDGRAPSLRDSPAADQACHRSASGAGASHASLTAAAHLRAR
jgi:hypothetical protein